MTGPLVSLCTLAIHAPYRRRARVLCADAPNVPWTVLTDAPDEFADMPVRAVAHTPTGPMADDYLGARAPNLREGASAAYHDKRFAILDALRDHDTAIFLDADTRIGAVPALGEFPPGLSVVPIVRASIFEHLARWGTWRLPFFTALAEHLLGDATAIHTTPWCSEACIAVTKDGREGAFFEAWARAAAFLQEREVFSGEGGVLGLAAACARWTIDYEALLPLASSLRHEGRGPKDT